MKTDPAQDKPKGAQGANSESNSGPERPKLTRAPKPPSVVGGLGTGGFEPEVSEVPHNPPSYFPSDLWPQTNLILLKAQKKFPLRTETVKLCEHILAEMTPVFVEAVKTKRMKASDVQREHGGGMEDLLRLLLILNDPVRSSTGISDEAYRIGEEVRKSDAWLSLAEAIAAAGRIENQASEPVERKPGRPRLDRVRELVREKKAAGNGWKQIAQEVNDETGQNKSPEAYRSLLRAKPRRGKNPR